MSSSSSARHLERSYSQGMVAGARLGLRHRQHLKAWLYVLGALAVVLGADRVRGTTSYPRT